MWKHKRLKLTGLVVLAFTVGAWGDNGVDTADPMVRPGSHGGPKRPTPRSVGLPGAFDIRNRVKTPALDVAALVAEDAERAGGGPQLVGVVQEFRVSSATDGKWTRLPDGGWLWTISFKGTGAQGVRLRIQNFKPGRGGELIIYNAVRPQESLGPFTEGYRRGTLWTPIIFGDQVNLEYYLSTELDHTGGELQITVDGLVNMFHPFGGGPGQVPPVSCHLDMSCYANWQLQADGVGALYLITDTGAFLCSGAMLNRVSGAEDFTPLFMTATHCNITAANVGSMLVTWGYQTQTCNGNDAPGWASLTQQPALAVIRSGVTSDWSIIGMQTIASTPDGVTFEGWSSGELDNDVPVLGIHHPRGTFKRISFGLKDGNDGTRPPPIGGILCLAGDAYEVEWPDGSGLTEPGSSGSPLFDFQGRVRGTLSCGGRATCVSENTSSYGRLDEAYSFLQYFLNPVDPVYVDAGTSGFEDGSAVFPFNEFLEGVFAVRGGSDLYMLAGSYNQAFTIDKPMTVHSLNGVVTIGQ